MNACVTTLTAIILGLGLLRPAPVWANPEDEPPAETPVETDGRKPADQDAAPTLDELLGLEVDDSEASAAEQAQRETDEELQMDTRCTWVEQGGR